MKLVYFLSVSILFWSNVSFSQTCNLANEEAEDMLVSEVLGGLAGIQKKPDSCCSFELPGVRIDFSKAPFNFESMHKREVDRGGTHYPHYSTDQYHASNDGVTCYVYRQMKDDILGRKANLSGAYEPESWTDNEGILFLFIENGLPEEYRGITLGCNGFDQRPLEGAKVSELPMPIREAIQVPCTRIQLQQINFQYEDEVETGVAI